MGAEGDSRRREFAAAVLAAVLRIGDRSPMAIRIAEMHPRLRRMIEFIRRLIISEPIPTIVCEPQVVVLRIPIESHRVPDTASDDLVTAPIRIETRDQGIAVRVRLTDIARRSDGHIELAVRTERDKFPSM